MKWYYPSYAGDFRLEPLDPAATYRDASADKGDACVLKVLSPTAGEIALLEKFLAFASKRGWTSVRVIRATGIPPTQDIVLATSLATAGTRLLKFLRPKDSTLTAVSFQDGRVVTTSGTSDTDVAKIAKELEKEPKAAVSVSRPTPCCPDCKPGAIGPASEVLLAFLTPEQHTDWAEHRAFRARGQLSGHDYLVMHRHHPLAVASGRHVYDLTDDARMDFHDVSLPPEEEALSAKLVLEHAEPWLRNRATCLHSRGSGVLALDSRHPLLRRHVFGNPFGDVYDGMESAAFTVAVGILLELAKGNR